MIAAFALAALAPAAPAPAPAADPQEVACVYEALKPEERRLVSDWLTAEEGAAEAARKSARVPLDRSVAACTERFKWGGKRRSWGGAYALSRIDMEATGSALPPGLAPATVEAAFLSLSEEDRSRFSLEGAEAARRDEPWVARTKAKLVAGGIPVAQLGRAVDYILTFAQFRAALAAWETLAKSGQR